MSSHMNRQFDKRHAVTVVAAADIAPYRFVSYGGQPAPAAPDKPLKEVQGVSAPGKARPCLSSPATATPWKRPRPLSTAPTSNLRPTAPARQRQAQPATTAAAPCALPHGRAS